jgi:LysM domain
MPKQCRKSITTLVFVLAWAFCALALAQAPKTPLALKPDAPDRYVVVKGDTLWSIAERYTDSPWRWPELWNMNKDQIKNPHRIYPGDVIVLDRARGHLALSGTVKLSPQVRAESTARAEIPSIPPSVIEPFLTRPLVVEPDGLDNAPTIVATEESHVYLGAGERAYVKGMSGAAKESVWFLYRRGSALVDPETHSTLGYEALYLGTARVQSGGDPAVVELTSVTQEVGVGDKLVAAGKPDIPTYAPRAPSGSIHGRVISLYGSGAQLSEAGETAVVAINRGKSQGIEVGNVLALYRPGSALAEAAHARRAGTPAFDLPDERYGLAFVFRVFDKVSYALVMNVSRPVNKLDLVQNP